MTLITDTDTLSAFCARQKGTEFLTVDTEFMREKTYWPKLCLVQVAGPDEAVAIDVLADGLDLDPLFELMADETILKVFHAARQDLEIFFHMTGRLPVPVFDTQVAAMVCGFGDSVGYGTLAARLAKANIDKSSRFTDWSARPLTDKQIQYALSDVTHLRVIYEKLAAKLHDNKREHWLTEEMGTLTAFGTYELHPELAFKRIKTRGGNARFLAILREVAGWRETEAQRRDLPRNRMLRDEALVEIAHHPPKNVDDLMRIRGLGKGLAQGGQGKAILAAVKRGRELPKEDCPQPPERIEMPKGLGPVSDLLKVLLKMKCDHYDVAQKLLASANDIELIAMDGEKADVPAMHGWRREVFGEDALRLRAGEIGLCVTGRKLEVVEVD